MYDSNLKTRFLRKVDKKGPNDCWNWAASTATGYGKLTINHKTVLAHRVAWNLVNGPIPKDMLVLHKCDNSLCCNPNHLSIGTQKDNVRDCSRKNRRGCDVH